MNKAKDLLVKLLFPKNGDDNNPTDSELIEAIAELEAQENESLEMPFQMDKGSTAMYPPKVIFFDGYIYELKGNK